MFPSIQLDIYTYKECLAKLQILKKLDENLQNLILKFLPSAEIEKQRKIANDGLNMISGRKTEVFKISCNSHWNNSTQNDKIDYTWNNRRTRKGFHYETLKIKCDCLLLESVFDPDDLQWKCMEGCPYILFFVQNNQLLLFIVNEFIDHEYRQNFEMYANLKYFIYGCPLNIEKLKQKIHIINDGCVFKSLKQHFEMKLLNEWFVEGLNMEDE